MVSSFFSFVCSCLRAALALEAIAGNLVMWNASNGTRRVTPTQNIRVGTAVKFFRINGTLSILQGVNSRY